MKRLASNGRTDDAASHDISQRRVDDAAPTPLGAQLGIIVFEQLRVPAVEQGDGDEPTARGVPSL